MKGRSTGMTSTQPKMSTSVNSCRKAILGRTVFGSVNSRQYDTIVYNFECYNGLHDQEALTDQDTIDQSCSTQCSS